MSQWECFRDSAYYDMWCVREKTKRGFGEGYHLVNGDEATALCDRLNTNDHPAAEDYFNRAQRAEQECAELRDRIMVLEAALATVVVVAGTILEGGEPCSVN